MPYPELEIKLTYKCKSRSISTPVITDSGGAAEVIMNVCDKNKILFTEELLMLCLYDSGKLMGWHRLSSGHSNSTVLDIRAITTIAAASGAHKIILAHNHPSGGLTPSTTDITGTQLVRQALNILGRELVDHIIFTQGAFLSMQEAGYFD